LAVRTVKKNSVFKKTTLLRSYVVCSLMKFYDSMLFNCYAPYPEDYKLLMLSLFRNYCQYAVLTEGGQTQDCTGFR